MKKLLLIPLSIFLLGCGTTQIVSTDSKTARISGTSSATTSNTGNTTQVLSEKTVARSGHAPVIFPEYFSKEVNVENTLTYLASDALNGREAGSPGIEKAAQFVEGIFKGHQVQPYYASYRDELSNFKGAFNVIGVVPGNDEKLKSQVVLIGAHYDHIGLEKAVNGDAIANGANDNAAGTTAVIELAKYFSKAKSNKRTLVFALFSAEEKGLLGSVHLAKRMKSENMDLYAMVNFEMIGVPMVGKSYIAYLTGYKKSNMAERFNAYAAKELVGFLPTAEGYNLFQRSDNYPFYNQFNVPSHTVCTFDFTNFDYYHHVDDEASEMDFAHMTNLINEMIPVLTTMANTPTKEIKMN